MYVAVYSVLLRKILKPSAVVARARQHQLDLRSLRQQPGQRGDQCVHPFVPLRRQPAPYSQNHAPRRKALGQRGMKTWADQSFELRIERPRQNANSLAPATLILRNGFGG